MLTTACWQGEKRTRFLASLFDWITARVANTSASPGATSVPYLLNSEPGLSLNQRLAKWQFIALDLNRNRVSYFLCYQNWSTDSTFYESVPLCLQLF